MAKRSKSSSRWLAEHESDDYVKRARTEGWRSRAVFKLEEIQKRDRLIKPDMTVVDLGAAPGAWSQYVRHLVGGRVESLEDEVLYRFEFPERPGALLKFLEAISKRWNISLFHYRNHGSDFGRVLAGIQATEMDRDELSSHLDSLGYAYWDETDNPAYQLFLATD